MAAEPSFIALRQAAQSALEVQNAVNLSGVLHSLDQIAGDVLWPAARRQGKGTACGPNDQTNGTGVR